MNGLASGPILSSVFFVDLDHNEIVVGRKLWVVGRQVVVGMKLMSGGLAGGSIVGEKLWIVVMD